MFEALFLGIIQGLTEFLPISSSAHIRIVGAFMPHANDPGAAFTAITQIGTELAVLIYFRNDIIKIIRSWFRRDGSPEARLGTLIIIGTLPIIVLGYLGQDYITNNFRSLWLIASTLILFGLILGFADRMGKSEKDLSQLNGRDGILYGLAQSVALIPGVSRSGATIALGRLLGYKREDALRYSFLLALPAVFGSGLYELKQALGDSNVSVYSMPQILVAT
ncbi:MAG: undecaprenyl-diphosphatase, partial [Actinobacteria bacterium]|nr:undecaprenyl-diphosphatase [Actinomycetota bacterium]